MNSPTEDIKDMLEAESSLGLTFATDLFIGKEPSKPDNCVTLYDYGGRPPRLTFDRQNYYYPSVQVRVRNNDYRAGWALIQDIADFLHGLSNETLDGTLYTVIYVSSGPAFITWDGNSRAIFVVNLNVQRR